jgi:hypothetical protein
MNSIKQYELDKFNELKESMDSLINNIESINELNKQSKLNIVNKVYLLNKNLDSVNNDINSILIDIKNNSSVMDDSLIKKLEDHEYIDKTIYKLSPLILYYQLIKTKIQN